MLPEKKRNLIIGIIAIIIIVLVVIGLYYLSNFIKERGKANKEKSNSDYPSNYLYYGITKDTDEVYKVYGINESTEDYLNINTFYDIKDIKVRDKRFLIYSDATNELRYDEYKKEFYFYELDSDYNKDANIKLSNDYIVLKEDNILKFYPYGNKEKIKEISNNVSTEAYLINNNTVFYVQNDGVYAYDLSKESKNLIVPNLSGVINLIRVNSNYLYLTKDNNFWSYDLKNNSIINMQDYFSNEITFVDVYDKGFLYLETNENGSSIKKFNVELKETEDYEYGLFLENITFSYQLEDNKYYMQLVEGDKIRNVIIDIIEKKVIKELDNLYLIMVKVG